MLTCTPLNLASLAAKASSLALKSLSLCSSSSLVDPVLVVGALPSPLAVSCESREKVESFDWDVNGLEGWAAEEASNGFESRGWGGSNGFCWRAVLVSLQSFVLPSR